MVVLEINSVCRGSTGNIMLNIADVVRKKGGSAYTYSEKKGNYIPDGHTLFGIRLENLVHRAISGITGISGQGSVVGTKRLLREIKKINPDIVHLHNLHGWYINLPMLFDFLKSENIKVVWTLHDCWAFTAQCSHFTIEKCEKWKTGCYSCPRYKLYPNTYVDRTRTMYKKKKEWFTGVENMVLVTPSQWLADLTRQSFLKDYPVQVINNGIDLSVFKPTESNFKEKYNCQDKFVLLGVASGWDERKGLDVFIELAGRLDNSKYQIVLVGTNEDVDKQLPDNIISIHRTHDQKQLAEIYTAADVFVNPTREENFPTVNIEALACGTPVVTFDTGGSKEMISEKVGAYVPTGNVKMLESEIVKFCNASLNEEMFKKIVLCYDKKRRFDEYVTLYEQEKYTI